MSEPPPYETPTSHGSDTPTRGSGPVGAVSVPSSRPSDNKHLGDAKSSTFNPAMKSDNDSSPSTVGGGANGAAQEGDNQGSSKLSSLQASLAKAIPTSTEELKAQLEEAQATIVRLTKQVEDEVLTQRKTKAVVGDMRQRISEGTEKAMGTKVGGGSTGTAGVPVPIVAGLCLLSFLLAYLLF